MSETTTEELATNLDRTAESVEKLGLDDVADGNRAIAQRLRDLQAELSKAKDHLRTVVDIKSQLERSWEALVEDRDSLQAIVDRQNRILANIHDGGIDDVRYPKNDGTREWQTDLGVYLRGCAYATIMMPPEQMREFLELAEQADQAAGKGE